MQRVSQLMSPGDTAQFVSGTYSWSYSGNRVTKSGTASAPITYISTEKWGAKVVGGCAPIWNEGHYVHIVNFDVTGSCPDGLYTIGNYSKVMGNRVHDLPGSSGGYAGIAAGCCNEHVVGVHVIGNVVDNIGPWGGTNLIHGIYAAGSDILIYNNIVTRASAAGIHMWHSATDVTISNNVVANNGRYGIFVGAGDGPYTADYTSVVNNIVVNNGGPGLYEYGSVGTHNVFYNNLVYNNSPNFKLINAAQAGNTVLTAAQLSALFVNYTGNMLGDYRLRTEAVAINAGTTLCASGVSVCVPLIDFAGVLRPRGTAYDIGAYEY